MSGMLGQILGGLLGGSQQGAQHSAVAGVIQQVLSQGGSGSNGLTTLVSRFEAAGFGQAAQSWISTGQNIPLSSQDLSKVFSNDELRGWAEQAGTSQDKILQILSEAVPKAVDHVTPNGQLPTQSTDLMGMLTKFLGSHGTPSAA